MIYVVIVFAITLAIGVPIAFAIGLSGITHMFMLGDMSYFNVMVQRLIGGINSTSIVCIPFFILAGNLMNYGGITSRLYKLIKEMVGWIKGGLAYATIIVAMILSAILGSSNAVAAILGASIFPEMVRDGYDDDFSACLIAAGGTLGPIIPPGIGMVMMGTLCGVSVGKLFIAGIVPGIIIGAAYMVVAGIYTKKRHYGKAFNKFNFKRFIKAFVSAIPALMVPLIIVGGVIGGVFTPSEAGAVSVAAALLCGVVYREMDWKKVPKILIDTAITSAAILLIVAFGNVLGWTLVMDGIPAALAAFMTNLTTNKTVIMLVMVAAMIVIGCFIEGFSSYLIFAPVFAAVALAAGIDLVHFSMIFIVMINIGVITPPVGMVLFVSSNVTGTPLNKMAKTIWPFAAAATASVILLACCEPLVTYLPNLLWGN